MDNLIPIVIFIILSIIFGGKKKKKKESTKTSYFDNNGNVINQSKSKTSTKNNYSSNINSIKDALKSFKNLQNNNLEKPKVFDDMKSSKFKEQEREKPVNYDEKYSNYEQPRSEKPVGAENNAYFESTKLSDTSKKMCGTISESFGKTSVKNSFLLDFKKDLYKRNELKKAIVLKEIIGKCKAFQN